MIVSKFRSSFVSSLLRPQMARLASTLVVCGHKNGKIDSTLPNTVMAASKLGSDISVLIAGKEAEIDSLSKTVSQIEGVSKVVTFCNESFDERVGEQMSDLVSSVQKQKSFSHILFSATSEGKNVMPHLSVLVNGVALSDVMEIHDEDTFVRPMYAGNAITKVKSTHSPKVMTIRGTSFDKAANSKSGSSNPVEIEALQIDLNSASKTKCESEEIIKSDRPEITAAQIVIAGGRALKSAENFDLIYKLADKFKQGAAVGASRAAVDAGYVPNDLQIGQTGKVCAPDLYIAVGISGAIQHLAGMKDSKCIVAINTDEDAPIFQVSDIGLNQDLFKAIPELTSKI